jgi:hypothetical protein
MVTLVVPHRGFLSSVDGSGQRGQRIDLPEAKKAYSTTLKIESEILLCQLKKDTTKKEEGRRAEWNGWNRFFILMIL